MDFTPDLTSFQGLLISTDKTYSLSNLSSRGGNEQKIEGVLKCLFKYLHDVKYLQDGKVVENKIDKVRKLNLFTILNADLPVLQEMVDIDGINSVVWAIPTIPKCLLNEILWLFSEKLVYETIAFSRPQLALELVDVLIENIKESLLSTYLNKLKVITSACYRLISRLHFYNFDSATLKSILTHAYNTFLQCMNLFVTPPNISEYRNISKDDEYKYKGNCLQTLFNVIDNCMDHNATTQLFTSPDFIDLYLLTFKLDELDKEINRKQVRSQATWEYLNNCNSNLLDKCKELVMDVSVDIFCAWSEFELDGKSLQQTIGESAYSLRKKLLKITSISKHPVISMMEQIACKPIGIEEIINTTDSQTILSNITTNNNKKEWVHALLQRDNFFNEVAMIDAMFMNMELLNKNECKALFKKCQSYLSEHSKNRDLVQKLAAKSFQYCDGDTKREIMVNYFKNNIFFNMDETEEFQNMMTEIFNKLIITKSSDVSEIFDIFIQNPEKVYLKMFILAAENYQQKEIILKAMNLLKNFSNHYYSHDTEPSLIINIKNVLDSHLETEIQQQNFVKFICNLKNDDFMSGAKLLLLIIMPNIHRALLSNDIGCVNLQSQLLLEAYSVDELLEYRAPMLVMLAQVMEVVRCKIDLFVTLGPETLVRVIKLQTLLFDSYKDEIPENEAAWLKLKLTNLCPLNRYYFRKLWDKSNKTFVETVSGLLINKSTDVAELKAWLTLNFCSCTQSELCEVWESLFIYDDETRLEIFDKAFQIIQETESQNRTDKTYQCILNCYKNIVFIIRYKYFREPVRSEQVRSIIQKITSLANHIDDDHIEEVANNLIPLIVYIMEKKDEHSVDVFALINNSVNSSKLINVFSKVMKDT